LPKPTPTLTGASIDSSSGAYLYPLGAATSASVITFADPSNASVTHIQSTGKAGSGASNSLSHTLEAYAISSGSSPFFPYAAFALTGDMIGTGGLTDSYNSSVSPYDPTNPGRNGDIGINALSGQVIDLRNRGTVKGAVWLGPAGGSSNLRIAPTVTVDKYKSLSAKEAYPPITFPGSCTGLTSLPATCSVGKTGPNLTIKGGTCTLPGGTYCFSYVTVADDGSLTFSGKATVYVQNKLESLGTISPTSHRPAELQINAGAKVLLRGSAKLYGTVYVTNPSGTGTVVLGNDTNDSSAELFGAVVADQVQFRSMLSSFTAALHYDEALKASGPMRPAGGSVTMKMWRELK
ncbi:MAG: hypothetical protein HYZ91_03090, partial [Candidatus Omnitrophica bacterium]|nr:hypothetical protein [Candidatus Omnitrophota bacterium]